MAGKTSTYIFAFLMVTSLLATLARADKDDDVDVVLGPDGQIILKEGKKNKGSSIVIARRRRSAEPRVLQAIREFPDYD